VTVNSICPGGFMTAPNRRWADLHPEIIAEFRANIPQGDFGQPEDLGPLAVYLASDASRYMTGSSLVIDGGYTAWYHPATGDCTYPSDRDQTAGAGGARQAWPSGPSNRRATNRCS
jgi:hypothetical protein